jgi:hypothetical protein
VLGSLFSVLAAIGLIWAFGYVVLGLLTPRDFPSAIKRSAVALLTGTLLTGIGVLPVLLLVDDPIWFDRALRWFIPILTLLGAVAIGLRRRAIPRLPRKGTQALSPAGAAKRIIPVSSAIFLVLATVAIVAFRPGDDPTSEIELYGSRRGDTVHITVSSTASRPADYLLVLSEADRSRQTFPVNQVSEAAGPQSISVDVAGPVRVELFARTSDGTSTSPLRWLMLPGQDGRL